MLNPFGPAVRALIGRCALPALFALAAVAQGCVPEAPGARGPYPAFSEFEGRDVSEVRFVGELELPQDSLRDVVITRGPQCWLLIIPVCLPFTDIGRDAYELDLQELARDVVRLQLYYRDHGFYGTRVVPDVEPAGDDEVAVRFAISSGDRVILRDLDVAGTEEVVDPARLIPQLPLKVGEPFRRSGFLGSADTIRSVLLRRGHAYADVLRNYSIDTIADVAEAQFIAIPGPLVYVDTILFAGVNRISEETLRRQITLEEGELLVVPEVNRSQRNLYDLQMVSFASVEIAPDTLQLDADSATATVLARVVEAPEYVVDAAVGVGTVECVRAETRYLDRSFFGGGRSLELTGFVSRIGAAEPLATGFGRSVCGAAPDIASVGDPGLVDALNYRLEANFRQPRLLSTRNELGVLVHAERLLELQAYLRESVGAQVAVSRELGPQTFLNTTLTVQEGRTLANPVVFCIGLEICEVEAFEELERRRWTNALSVTGVYDRTRAVGPVSRGHLMRGAVDWSSPVLGSDTRFLRLLFEGSAFRPIRPGWVLAGNVRAGSFLLGALGVDQGFLPPERRFFAGGPNSVRGFRRNGLGPTAYLEQPELDRDGIPTGDTDTLRAATGGTQMVTVTAEVRAPSPFLSEFFRVAAFVDAGEVWAPGSELFGIERLNVTPGVGLRVITPVGPVRLDVAYNPNPLEAGALYRVDPLGDNLLLLDPAFQPPDRRSFWDRLQFSFAVGQAF